MGGNEQFRKFLNLYNYVFNLDYIDPLLASNLIDEYIQIKNPKIIDFFKSPLFTFNFLFFKSYLKFKYLRNLKTSIYKHNYVYIKNNLEYFKQSVGYVENNFLDEQQLTSIIKMPKNHLVVAGAGSGKTTTIIGKISALIKIHNIPEKSILALSFTNSSASDLEKRILSETNKHIDVFTFHKLGLEIIKNGSTTKIPRIFNRPISDYVKESFEKHIQDDNFLSNYLDFCLFARSKDRYEHDFNSESEYKEYIDSINLKTLKGESVKSYSELDIANFLYINNINYIYEINYPFDTTSNDHLKQYQPDFFLCDYDVYIEFYSLDNNNCVPSYYTTKGSKNPTQTYIDSINWKRKVHKKYKTNLLEFYYYQKQNGTLFVDIKNSLSEMGIILKKRNLMSIFNDLAKVRDFNYQYAIELISTVITLIKSNNIDFTTLSKLNENLKTDEKNNNLYVLKLVNPIYDEYISYLKCHNLIDFNDMINLSTKIINEKLYITDYKFIIVDEYQDISRSRIELLKAIKLQNDGNLFCVGDDWQSIYRFAGSDVGFLTNFSQFWGVSEIDKIETTYRFPINTINLSSSFIMKNSRQIKKNLIPFNKFNGSSIKFILKDNNTDVINEFINVLYSLPKFSNIFLIGRYSCDISIVGHNLLTFSKNKFHLANRDDLNILYINAHKSKGLQADFVFLINNFENGLGFPSKITDHPILNLLLETEDDFLFSEERRLFYVALTRSKFTTYLLVNSRNASSFVRELSLDNRFVSDFRVCPKCGSSLTLKKGKYGKFYGCSRFPKCNYTEKYKG